MILLLITSIILKIVLIYLLIDLIKFLRTLSINNLEKLREFIR